MSKKSAIYDVFTIVANAKTEKNFWIKVGVAFQNKDNSLNVKLNAFPVDGKLQIREKTAREES